MTLLPWLVASLAALLALPTPSGTPDPKDLVGLANRIRLTMPPGDAPLVLTHDGGPDGRRASRHGWLFPGPS